MTTAGPFGTADAAMFADAGCIGRHTLFDAPEAHEHADLHLAREQAAAELCEPCPCRAPCWALAMTIPKRDRSGVWAGTAWCAGTPRRLSTTTTTTRETDDVPVPAFEPTTERAIS